MNEFERLYPLLNEGQRQAVDHMEGPMMVLAGAGTGKTQVIAMRIANLLKNWVEPYNILCLTFTETGVAAMRERLVRILGSAGYFVKVHTFHSFCNEVIQEHPERFVFAKELVPLADLEKMQVMGELLDAMDVHDPLKTYGDPYYYRKAILSNISMLKRERVEAERLEQMVEGNRVFLKEVGDVLEEFAGLDARNVTQEKILNSKSEILNRMQNDTLEDVKFLYKSLLTVLEQSVAEAELNPGKSGKVSYKGVRDAVKRFYESIVKHIEKQGSLVEVYRAYQAALVERGRYDFDDMILFVLKELEKDPVLRAEYLERYQFILIDEYQDTNASQNSLARMFGVGVERPNIFVVGDDDQAIYRFQGANLENVLGFYHNYAPEISLVTLVDNYRSHQQILTASGNVIAKNIFRAQIHLPEVTKELRAAVGGDGEQLKYVTFDRYEDEMVWITEEIQQKIQNLKPQNMNEIAILTRTNGQSDEVVRYLQLAQIPYVLERGESVFDVMEVRQFMQLMRVIAHPYDDETMFFLLHARFLGMPVNDVLRLHFAVQKERREDRSKRHLIDAMQDEGFLESAKVEQKELLMDLAKRLLAWREEIYNESVIPVTEKIFVNSGMMKYVEDQSDSLVLLSAFKALLDYACAYVGVNRHANLEELLGYLDDHEVHEVTIPYHVTSGDGKGVRVMTVHKAKGLEFEYVFIPQCTDKLWGEQMVRDKIKLPLQMITHDVSVLSKEALEDERRLFYVALTRGKKDVIISFAQHDQKGKEQMPSRFIEEIGGEYLLANEMRDFRAPSLMINLQHNPAAKIAEDILAARMAELRLSATNVNDYLHCPRLFYYKHFIRAPIMRSKYMALGTATHEAVEALYRSCQLSVFSFQQEGDQLTTDSRQLTTILSKEEMLAIFERVLWKEMFDVKDFKDSLEKGKRFLEAYYDHYKDELMVPMAIEYDFGRDFVYLGDIPLAGKVDLIELVDPLARKVVFYDFKTGNPDRKMSELKPGGDIWRQMVMYKLMSQLSKKFAKQYVMLYGCVDFIERNKNGEFVREKVETNEEAIQAVSEEIKGVWDAVHRLEFKCRDEKGKCDYCEGVLRDIQED